MVPISVELTMEKIKEAISKNLEEFCDILPKDQFTVYQEAGLKWISSFFPHVVFNRADDYEL